jgi:hypothetical protein
MATTTSPASVVAPRERAVRAGIGMLGAISLAIGLYMAISPSGFFRAIGPFGALNDHYVRDMSTWQIGFGAAMLLAVGRPSWRRPLIAVGGIQAVLHALNHLIDVGDSDPSWVGVFDLVTLAASAGLFLWLWSASAEAGR